MSEFRFDNNNYEYNTSSKWGVYLMHGFSSTTYEIKALAQFLAKNGYYTLAKNLPGHGTNISECNKIKYELWLNTVKQDLAEMSTKCNKIFVVGNSMGGVLSLYLASLFPVNAFVSAGTVLKFKNHFTTNYIVPLICKIIKSRPKNKVNKLKNIQFYGYTDYPLIALNEFRKMNKVVTANLKNIKVPGLIIHSHSDRMSIKDNIAIIKKNILPEYIKILMVNKAHHNMFDENPDQKLIFNEVLQFLNSH